ncbi:Membrane protein involved in the export of O-antigen and teichoic acid [Candidatus Thermokryptus mobilis]|uniref:Membrane protein involved in the export of O-antigen and teichoic acid n=1 Tax=Candidatus Thermokryptus mobilis TaxID=1643428 RepID=A0A0S4NEV2_9BACT|nr:oligosaccharide flippase family protein [Candidatus Thermokryptus mobilis]CUU08774.1 Membrane protein involved in the export of O-antigen and teichoic acid [Candidatus Thermokryptus mobilis]
MFDQIKQLGKETAIYGLSTIIGRFLNFILVPFYTNVLKPDQYGIVTTIYAYIAFLNIIYSYGMESAYMRYASSLEIGSKKENFSTPFISIFLTSLLFSSIIHIFSEKIANLINIPIDFSVCIRYSAWILFFDALCIIPLSALRLEGKAMIFSTIKIVNIVVNVTLNIVLLLKFKLGVYGVFISGVASSALTFLMVLPIILKNLSFSFLKRLYIELLKFGLPYIPSGLSAIVIQVIDRPILKALTDDATVGIYQANYRLGIFMMLFVSMFDYAWRPFFLRNANNPDAKKLFSRVMTYFTLVGALLFILVSLLIEDFVKLKILGRYIIHPDYWLGLGIVPIVLLGYLFNGIYVNLIVGIYIQKKTKYLPYITGIGAIANILGNYTLIPILGMYGSAWATLISYLIMAISLFIAVQRIYPIRYEYERIAKIGVATALSFTLSYVTHLKLTILILFFIFLLGLRFFTKEEIKIVRKIF